ncbi:TM2 domain protein, partial [Vibrio parahaemolyticus VPTS-2010_2]
CT